MDRAYDDLDRQMHAMKDMIQGMRDLRDNLNADGMRDTVAPVMLARYKQDFRDYETEILAALRTISAAQGNETVDALVREFMTPLAKLVQHADRMTPTNWEQKVNGDITGEFGKLEETFAKLKRVLNKTGGRRRKTHKTRRGKKKGTRRH